eukprot:CAMPEP_0168517914 /NCGR_PEP_ID=MMETSP0405-20121227/6378_1 /TAXON_ID=498012 /ORGANISM="Trichosphaerium sp, Strain Am-I-7 wt" /LENGTH=214 /DNA_ID=CAMNT_0008538101 /DNA_START=8 /DNA_END=649 /DNA_ORIENTATION=+
MADTTRKRTIDNVDTTNNQKTTKKFKKTNPNSTPKQKQSNPTENNSKQTEIDNLVPSNFVIPQNKPNIDLTKDSPIPQDMDEVMNEVADSGDIFQPKTTLRHNSKVVGADDSVDEEDEDNNSNFEEKGNTDVPASPLDDTIRGGILNPWEIASKELLSQVEEQVQAGNYSAALTEEMLEKHRIKNISIQRLQKDPKFHEIVENASFPDEGKDML